MCIRDSDRRTRTIIFGRYSYEDVRLFNLESLVVRPILEPDRKVRLSRFGASLVRDTRERCERGLLARSVDEDDEPGAPGEVCRYNQVDATRGGFLLSLIHISEPTRQAEISYAVFCLKKKN